MKGKGLAFKFLLPVSVALGLVLGLVIWGLGAYQTSQAEKSFQDQVAAVAVASRSMFHLDAEDYCTKRGMTFHRVEKGRFSEDPVLAAFERNSLERFAANPSMDQQVIHLTDQKGNPKVYALTPGRLKDTCMQCHGAFGIETFKDRKVGDLVAAFGVSMPTAELYATQRNIRIFSALLGVGLLVVISAIVAARVKRGILAPLDHLSSAISKVATGDMTAAAPVESEDEIAQLATTFNRMVGDLRSVLNGMESASERVASGSIQLASSAEQIARTIQETARTGEDLRQAGMQVSQAVRQLDANVESMAHHTTSTTAQVVEAVSDTDRGAETGRGTADGMKAIQQATGRIVQAIKVIQGIARQTNLLSLNAAIEAAKAGAHGQGFAVVAEEVRVLAERSGHSAKEIEEIIQAMHEAVNEGAKSVEVTLHHLEAIRSRISQVSGSIQEITSLSQGQARTSHDVGRMMDQTASRLDQNAAATHEVAASVQEVSRTAEELSQVAEHLKDTVRRFRLR